MKSIGTHARRRPGRRRNSILSQQIKVCEALEDRTLLSGSSLVDASLQDLRGFAGAYDGDFDLIETGNDYRNWGGSGERWVQSTFDTEWHFITPEGDVYRWDGSPRQASGEQVVSLPAVYHTALGLLTDAENFQLDRRLQLRPTNDQSNLFENWGGRSEKWLKSQTSDWYFLTPDGSVFLWDGSAGANGLLAGTVAPAVYSNVSQLTNSVERIETELHTAVIQIDASLGLQTSSKDFQNWGGAGERWIAGSNAKWYYITPDGNLFEWDGQTPASQGGAQPLGGTLVAGLVPAYHQDLSLVTAAASHSPAGILDIWNDPREPREPSPNNNDPVADLGLNPATGGNVTVELIGNQLVITGDSLNNRVAIMARDSRLGDVTGDGNADGGEVVVVGLAGTTINGPANTPFVIDDPLLVDFTAGLLPSIGLQFSGNDGEDILIVSGAGFGQDSQISLGEAPSESRQVLIFESARFDGNLLIGTGNGVDDIFFSGVNQIGGDLLIGTGAGDDTLTVDPRTLQGHREQGVLTGLNVGGNMTVNMDLGNDDVILNGATIGQTGSEVFITLAPVARAPLGTPLPDDDRLLIENTTISASLVVAAGAGNDQVLLDGTNHFLGDVGINLEEGHDRLIARGQQTFSGDLDLAGSSGDDSLSLGGASILGSLIVSGALGNDLVDINNSTVKNSAEIGTAHDNDTVVISKSQFSGEYNSNLPVQQQLGQLNVGTGDGNDVVQLVDNIFTPVNFAAPRKAPDIRGGNQFDVFSETGSNVAFSATTDPNNALGTPTFSEFESSVVPGDVADRIAAARNADAFTPMRDGTDSRLSLLDALLVPVPENDTLEVDEDLLLVEPPPGLLGNDEDSSFRNSFVLTVVNTTDPDYLPKIGNTFPQAFPPAANAVWQVLSNGSISFRAAQDFNSTAAQGDPTFDYRITDGFRVSAPATVAIHVVAVNDAPVLNLPVGPAPQTNEDTPLPLPGINITDVDVDEFDPANPEAVPRDMQLIVTAANGTVLLDLAGGGGGADLVTVIGGANDSATVTLQGTRANLNTVLNTLTFTPTLNYNDNFVPVNGNATVTLTVSDLGNTPDGDPLNALTDTETINIAVNPVNDAPEFLLPAGPAPSTNEDTPVAVPGITITDIDVDENDPANPEAPPRVMELTITGANATVLLDLAGGGGGADLVLVTAGANDSPAVTVSGTRVNLNAVLNTLIVTPAPDINDNVDVVSINLVVSDLGNTPDGNPLNALTDTETIVIAVAPVNDAPAFVLPAGPAPSTSEDTPVAVPGITITDVDVDENDPANLEAPPRVMELTITGTNGTVQLDLAGGGGGADLVLVTGGANDSGNVTLVGTRANLNAVLNTLFFTPAPNFNDNLGAARVDLSVSDLGNTPDGDPINELTAAETVAIAVAPQNDPPELAVPGDQSTLPNVALVFSNGNGNAIVVSDPDLDEPDAGNPNAVPRSVSVTITVTNGTGTLGSIAGLTSVIGDGTALITLEGPLAAVNGALNGLTFTPTAGFNGNASVQVDVSDLGNSPDGNVANELTDSETIQIRVNTPPQLNSPAGPFNAAAGSDFEFSLGNGNPFSISDADLAGGEIFQSIGLSVNQEATLTFFGVSGAASITVFNTTLNDLNAALATGVLVSPVDAGFTGDVTLTVTLNDGFDTVTETFTITFV